MGLADLVRHSERALLPVLPRFFTLWLESLYFSRFGEAELALLPRLMRPGWDAVDVGGHEGAYAIFLRKLARRVHVFEPVPLMAKFLRQKFGDSVQIHEEALSSTTGQAVLHFPRRSKFGDPSALASLNDEVMGGQTDIVEIPVRTSRLDDHGFDRVGLIKIDVEGHEEAVLAGARATIERCRPSLIVEIEERHAKGALERIAAWFDALAYDCLYLHEGRLVPLGSSTAAELQASGSPFVAGFYIRNFIFLPREHSSEGWAR
ncbi:MAG TPA: FkbM family methyltransferase [Magnetospirillaceae bacterium]|nr:FkbM family methyltransferase [Magnetospirillaceae bacterium]